MPPASGRLIGLYALSRATRPRVRRSSPPLSCFPSPALLFSVRPSPTSLAPNVSLFTALCRSRPALSRRRPTASPGRARGLTRPRAGAGVGWPAHARPHIKPSAYKPAIQYQRIPFAGSGPFAHACACAGPENRRIHSTNSRHGNRTPGGREKRKPHNVRRESAESEEKSAEINGADFGECG
jgi:hypothetical protein